MNCGFLALAVTITGCTVQPAAKVARVDAGPGLAEGPGESLNGPVATQMGPQLASIGLDVAKLPDLSSITDKNLIVVMKAFAASLGAQCTDCHVKDFSADTPRKRVAEKMWDEFVQKLNRKDGSAVFCDSCHQGSITFLDRTDDMKLATWMNDNYVEGVTRKDGTTQSCTNCHGMPFNPDFLDGWEAGPDGGTVDGGHDDGGVVADLSGAHDLSTIPPSDLSHTPDLGVCKPSVNEVQVAGSGGAADEFVELFNPCSTSIDLAGHRLVYRSAAGASDVVLVKLDGQTLAAGAYLVIGNNDYTGTATLHYSSSLANTSGGVAIEDSTDAVVDSVAWGTATNAFVQGKPAAAPPASKSVARIPDGSHAHESQSLDLVVGTPTPGAAN